MIRVSKALGIKFIVQDSNPENHDNTLFADLGAGTKNQVKANYCQLKLRSRPQTIYVTSDTGTPEIKVFISNTTTQVGANISMTNVTGDIWAGTLNWTTQGASEGYYYLTIENGTDTAVSEPIDLRDSHPYTQLIEYTNYDNAYDIIYEIEPNISFDLIVNADIFQSQDSEAVDILLDDENTATLLHDEVQDIFDFTTSAPIPSYLKEKIRAAIGHDECTINGIKYIKLTQGSWERFGPYGRMGNYTVDLKRADNDDNINYFNRSEPFSIPIIPPLLLSATIEDANPSRIILTYDTDLDTGSVPVGSDYTVTVNAVGRTVGAVTISGPVVTLNLVAQVANGETVLCTYAIGSNPVRSDAPDFFNADPFTNQAVTNNVTQDTILGFSPGVFFFIDPVGHPGDINFGTGTQVDSINDLGSGGNDFASAGGSKPTHDIADGLLTYSDNNEVLQVSSASAFNFLHDDTTQYTIGMVVEMSSSSDGDLESVLRTAGNSFSQIGMRIDFDDRFPGAARDNMFRVVIVNGSGSSYVVMEVNTTWLTDQLCYIEMIYRQQSDPGNDIEIYYNDVLEDSLATISGTPSVSNSTTPLTQGPTNSGSSFKLGQIFIFKRLLTGPENTDKINYLNSKYGFSF